MKKQASRKKVIYIAALVLLLALGTVAVASCGGTSGSNTTGSAQEKLPPGATDASVTQESAVTDTTNNSAASDGTATGNSSTAASSNATASSATLIPVDVAGGHFEVVKVTRRENNKSVVSGNTRQVSGDYLEIELQVTDTGDTLLDLSDFSFRLESAGIDSSVYEDYYGTTGTYGAAISANIISGTLLDYSSLQQASYTLKSGELVDSIFLFFDVNPISTAKNAAVTLENTDLIIKKISGTSYGDKAYINLATPAG